MKNETNKLKIKGKEKALRDLKTGVGEKNASQKETFKECRFELSMSDYRELSRKAVQVGCTPEELVALRISQMLS